MKNEIQLPRYEDVIPVLKANSIKTKIIHKLTSPIPQQKDIDEIKILLDNLSQLLGPVELVD